MTETPRISVVVPNYNHARFLDRRLASIFAQTRRDFEVVFLDDASPDDSVAVARAWAGRHPMRLDLREKNTGNPFAQWNRGVSLARGEFVWIAESDDDAAPELLETLVGLLERDPQVVVAHCQSRIVDAHDTLVDVTARWYADLDATRWTTEFTNDGRDECRRFLCLSNTIPNASATVFRRSAYLAAAPANEAMRYSGDWLTWAALLGQGRFAYTPRALNRFRKHGANLTDPSKVDRFLADWLAIARMIDERDKLDAGQRATLLRRLVRYQLDAPRADLRPWSNFVAATRIARRLGPSGLFPVGSLRRITFWESILLAWPAALCTARHALVRRRAATSARTA
jgi:Glycosyltransferases involved in cell wall biogenesis